MGNVAGPCIRCGGNTFYADGACKGCSDVARKKTIARRLADGETCAKCGGRRDGDGRCVECRKARRKLLASNQSPCQMCGAADRDTWGHCRPCRFQRQAQLVVGATPCAKCGHVDRSASGKCRQCARISAGARQSQARSCKTCGAACRDKAGKCRNCVSRRLRERKYGLSRGEFDAMVTSQGGACAACMVAFATLPKKHTHVDHDHVTGAVRGVLCHACNTAIGLLSDSPSRAEMLARYLRTHAPTLPFDRKSA